MIKGNDSRRSGCAHRRSSRPHSSVALAVAGRLCRSLPRSTGTRSFCVDRPTPRHNRHHARRLGAFALRTIPLVLVIVGAAQGGYVSPSEHLRYHPRFSRPRFSGSSILRCRVVASVEERSQSSSSSLSRTSLSPSSMPENE